MESETDRPVPQPSSLASLFYRVPKVADIVVYNLSMSEAESLLLYTEAAIQQICHFAEGPGGGYYRLREISREGKYWRKYIQRLPDPPRLSVEEWQEKLIGKRLRKEDAEGSDDVGSLLFVHFWF